MATYTVPANVNNGESPGYVTQTPNGSITWNNPPAQSLIQTGNVINSNSTSYNNSAGAAIVGIGSNLVNNIVQNTARGVVGGVISNASNFAGNAVSGFLSNATSNLTSHLPGGIVGGIAGEVLGGAMQTANNFANSAISQVAGGIFSEVNNLLGGLLGSFGGPGSDLRPKLAFFSGHPFASYPGDLAPLAETGGLVWPYRPTISVSRTTNYAGTNVTHSIQEFYSYVNSTMPKITISGQFSASNTTEARYMYAASRFIVMARMMAFGDPSSAITPGTPPPLLQLSAYGTPNIGVNRPVFLDGANLTYPDNVDYVTITNSLGQPVEVPIIMNIDISAQCMFSPQSLRKYKLEKELPL